MEGLGLHKIGTTVDAKKIARVFTQFRDLIQRGFILVWGTVTISGSIDRVLTRSRGRTISLPYSPLRPLMINNQPVFDIKSIVGKIFVDECVKSDQGVYR